MRDWKEIPGDFYNWKKTLKPERPYIHDYSKKLTYKIFMAKPTADFSASDVIINYEDAFRHIKEIDAITLGVPKIAYLVGWQYYGHDHNYPAWHEMNEALKRPEDKCALDSYMWLFEEAKKYNTTVSVHINMFDAYENSPLWDTYVKEGLIATNEDDSLMKVGIWNGIQAYAVSYKREWDSGYAKKRIDEICQLLPLKEAGTVHIDALHAKKDVGRGFEMEDSRAARRKILRYWRDLGIDVTSEFLYFDTPDWAQREESTVGLLPLCYHFSQNLEDYVARPADLVCGGDASYRMKEGNTGRFANLFGDQTDKESTMTDRWRVLDGFCTRDTKFLYLNGLKREYARVTGDDIEAYFADGVVTTLKENTMSRNGALMQRGSDIIVPTPWHKEGSAVVYSRNGGSFTYDLKTILDVTVDTVQLRELGIDGLCDNVANAALDDGKLTVNLGAKQAFVIYTR